MITPGTYNAVLVMPKSQDHLFTTSNSGKDGIAMQFKLDDGADDITTTLWLTPAAYERSVQVLKEVFGFDGDFAKLARTLTLPNLECKLVIESEHYTAKDGSVKQAPKVRWINPRGAKQKAAAGGSDGVLQRLAKLGGNVSTATRNQTADDIF